MTVHDLADRMDRIASALRKLPDGPAPGQKPQLEGDMAVGAAAFLRFLRGLLTDGDKELFTREELLVLLEIMSRDSEIFPTGLIAMMDMTDQEAGATQ